MGIEEWEGTIFEWGETIYERGVDDTRKIDE